MRTYHGEDRLSKLPTCIITKILSYLPTKNAVATSVLSTNWKRLWTSITHLDFDDELFHTTPSLKSKASFASFVNFVLVLVKKTPPLRLFRLKCTQYYGLMQINWWVTAALLCYVREIDLSVRFDHRLVFLDELFFCKRLEVLKLGTNFELNIPSLVNLPSLTVLHLCYVQLSNDDSITRLICGCPLLEELNLRSCIGEQVGVVNIFSPTLKILTLTCLRYDYLNIFTGRYYEYRVLIHAPSLRELEITDCAAGEYVLKDANHLKTAKLYLDPDSSVVTHNKEALADLLEGVSQVRFLFLSLPFFQPFNMGEPDGPDLPKFRNLADVDCVLQLLPLFLKNSRIETLVIQKVINFSQLKLVNMPCACIYHLVQYFLENAVDLEKMILHYDRLRKSSVNTATEDELMVCKSELLRTKQDLECSNLLLKLPRVSNACQVVIL